MIQRNSTLAVLRESFVAGSDENCLLYTSDAADEL